MAKAWKPRFFLFAVLCCFGFGSVQVVADEVDNDVVIGEWSCSNGSGQAKLSIRRSGEMFTDITSYDYVSGYDYSAGFPVPDMKLVKTESHAGGRWSFNGSNLRFHQTQYQFCNDYGCQWGRPQDIDTSVVADSFIYGMFPCYKISGPKPRWQRQQQQQQNWNNGGNSPPPVASMPPLYGNGSTPRRSLRSRYEIEMAIRSTQENIDRCQRLMDSANSSAVTLGCSGVVSRGQALLMQLQQELATADH